MSRSFFPQDWSYSDEDHKPWREARWEHAWRLRMDEGLTYEVAALRLGVTRERVRQMVEREFRIRYPYPSCPPPELKPYFKGSWRYRIDEKERAHG